MQIVIEIPKEYCDSNTVNEIECLLSNYFNGTVCKITTPSKVGHWILKRTFPTKLYDEYIREYECSECHRVIRCTESQLVNYPYSHCGAMMIESEG